MNNQPKEIIMFDYIELLVKARWIIVRNMLIAVIGVVLLSFILPQKFTATATLMPPQEKEQNPMASMLSDVSIPGLSVGGQASSSEVLVEILHSRSVGERVLNKIFVINDDSTSLLDYCQYPSIAHGLIKMKKRTRFMASPHGIVTIDVKAETAQLAADIANAYVEALDFINKEKSVTRAKNSRIYLEKQLAETEKKLFKATKELAEFQQQHKAISLEDQTRATIEQAAVVMGQINVKEVEIGVMMQSMTRDNPAVIRAQKELDELRRRYNEMQVGANKADDYLAFTDVPEIGLQLATLTRAVQVEETVWQLLNQQYYQAKINEARDTPTVQVLDHATPPVYRTFPNRTQLVIVFGLFSFVLSIIWIFILNFYEKLGSRPDEKSQVDAVLKEIKSDFNVLKFFRKK